MRREERFIANGALIVGGITAVTDILNQWKECKDKGEEFTWEKYNGIRTIGNSFVGAAIGAGIGYAYYCYKISDEEGEPFNSDSYLKNILTQEHLKSDPHLLNLALIKRAELKQWLVNKFGNNLVAPPEDTGSFKKRTAIASNYDLDLVLPFRKDSYDTLENMYHDVHAEISNTFSVNAMVTKQSKAIGLTFNIENKEIHFDIVPGREIYNYHIEKDLNLYINPSWIWQRGSSFKTNISIQQSITVNKPQARQIIKLLKAYKDRNGFSLPTLLIEQCVVQALSPKNYGIHTSITENLLNSMDFISQKLNNKTLIDHANSNNNIHRKNTEMQREYIQSQLLNDIKRVEDNPRYIKEIFEL